MTTQFDAIYYGLSHNPGKFRVAASGVAWRAGDVTTAIPANNIRYAQWSRVARGFRLRVGKVKDDAKETFDGFAREHHEKTAALFKQHFNIVLESREISFKGWNWGATDLGSNELVFTVSSKPSFELPLSNVSNVNISGKDEVSLEFTSLIAGTSQGMPPDALVEIRFYIPASSKEGEDSGGESDDGDDVSAAEIFHKTIKAKTSRDRQGTPTVILNFEEVLLLTPRGRYDMNMYCDSLRLHGKTYDYRVFYSNITRMFLLPKDNTHLLFIIGLKSPIHQGQTHYEYLVIQYERSQEMSAELNITEEELEARPLLKRNYDGSAFEVIADVFHALVGKAIISSGNFKRGANFAIKANLKAVLGELFMLDKCILFVTRQPTLINLGDIYAVAFSRVGRSAGVAAARTFDLRIIIRSGPEYIFTLINQDEHGPIEAFLKERKVKIKGGARSDTDLNSGGSRSGGDDGFHTGSDTRQRETGRNPDYSEDSEEDADFQGSSSDEGSFTLDSELSDGGADTASDTSGDRDTYRPKATAKKTKIQKERTSTDASTRIAKTDASSITARPISAATFKPSYTVSEGSDIDIKRPKKKLKMRA